MKILMAPFKFIGRLFHYALMGFLSIVYFIYSLLYAVLFEFLLKPFRKKNNFETESSKELKKKKIFFIDSFMVLMNGLKQNCLINI